MIFLRSILFLLCFTLLLPACTNINKEKDQTNIPVESININNRKVLANDYYKKNDYANSLTQWKILRTIQPDNVEFKNRIRVLEVLIKRRSKMHLNHGREAIKRNDYKTAELSLLKALALNPRHTKALTLLKKIEAGRVENIQQAKTRRLKKKQLAKLHQDLDSYQTISNNTQEQFYLEMGLSLFQKGDWSGSIREIEKYLSINEHDQKAKNTVAKSHFKLSRRFESRGHLEPAIQHLKDGMKHTKRVTEEQIEKLTELKITLSENFYINGVKTYRSDIKQAILYWERAIDYNPNHFKAKNRLAKANQMQKNLNKIKK